MVFLVTPSKVVGDLQLGDKKVTFLITWYKASLFGGFVLASGVSRPESMTIAIICSTMLVLRPANHSKVHLYKIPCGTNICCFFQEFTSPIRDSGPLEPLDQCTKRISPWQMIQQVIATTLILENPTFFMRLSTKNPFQQGGHCSAIWSQTAKAYVKTWTFGVPSD